MAAAKKKAAKKTVKVKVKAKPPRKNSIREPSAKPPKPRGGGGDKLTEEQKFFLVDQLATFVPLMTALEALKTEWPEIEITRQSAQHYDPTTYAGRVLSEALKTRFHDVRQRYREETANLAASGRAERVRRLQRMADAAENMKNFALAKEILKQIAEEMGDVFTNNRRVGVGLGLEDPGAGKGGNHYGGFEVRLVSASNGKPVEH
jgi:hypothetical protein